LCCTDCGQGATAVVPRFTVWVPSLFALHLPTVRIACPTAIALEQRGNCAEKSKSINPTECGTGAFAEALVPCYLLHVRPRLVIDSRENFRTTTLVLRHLVLQTYWDTQGTSVTFEARVGNRARVGVVPQGAAPWRATQPARRITASNP